jgi:hypothetical protein
MPLAVVAPIISAAVAAAGAGYGIEQTSAAQNKMNQDVANTVGQEQQLQKQATPIYQQNLQKATSQQPAQQGIAQALQGYQRAAQAPVSTQPIVDAPPSKTVDARTAADVARQQQASAAVAQYPAQQTAWNVGNTNTNAQLGNISSIGQSIASTLQPNLLSAQEQGTQGQAIGNAVGSVGGVIGAAGAAQKTNASYTALLNALTSGTPTSIPTTIASMQF